MRQLRNLSPPLSETLNSFRIDISVALDKLQASGELSESDLSLLDAYMDGIYLKEIMQQRGESNFIMTQHLERIFQLIADQLGEDYTQYFLGEQ